MQVLGRELPPEIEALYNDVVQLRPEASIKFQMFVPPAGLDVAALHVPDYTGDSEVRLTAAYDLPSLVHALLHVFIYRKGYPVATNLAGSDPTYGSIALSIGCCVSHAAMEEEVGRRPALEPYWREELAKAPGAEQLSGERLPPLDAWRLADAIAAGQDGDVLAEACRAQQPETWRVVEKLLEVRERCRQPSGMRWYRAMTELVHFFDGVLAEMNSAALPPSQAIIVSLVVSEPQLQRSADRLVELVPLQRDIVGFVHKQEGALFHIRFALPGRQKREIAELLPDLRLRTEDFLNKYWVPYTVDLRVAARN